MSFLAVSLLGLAALDQTKALAADPVWERIQPNLLRLDSGGVTLGHAVLIDPKGLFLAARSSVSTPTIVGWAGPTRPVTLVVVATDETTQMLLLKSEDWVPQANSGTRILAQIEPGARLIVATPNGPVRAEFVSADRIGVVRPSLRYTPLAEIRLESAVGPVGGSPVFTETGGLAGVLGATLIGERASLAPSAGQPMKAAAEADSAATALYGPQGMTVAYALSPAVLQRVVLGFLSADHKVRHPSIGVFFKAATEGVLLEAVMPDSPAARAGLKAGEVIVSANGQAVRTPVEFARLLFGSAVGDKLQLRIRSGKTEREVEVIVGVQDSDS